MPFQVIVHDHVGFGFSDKPVANFTYSVVSEHADVAIKLWSELGVKQGILIAHDMGECPNDDL